MPLTVKELERRILTSPLKPLKLRKRRATRPQRSKPTRRNEGDTQQTQPKSGDEQAADGDADTPADEPETNDDDQDPKETSNDSKSPGTVTGYAAVFYSEQDPGSEYCLWEDPSFKAMERIARGAFSRAIREMDDCRALYNHDPNMVLGRTSSGTMRLTEDETGLRYDVDLPDTTLARDLAELVGRGDINGSSFGFVVEQESWRETEEEGGRRVAVRTIESVRLLDVGPVTYPAYASTTTGTGEAMPESNDADEPPPEPDQNADPSPQQPDQNADDDQTGSDVQRSRRRVYAKRAGQRAWGNVAEARSSYQRWKAKQNSDVPLAAKLAAVRARAATVEAEAC